MIIQSLILIALAVVCYSITQLQAHGKLKWSNDDADFWGAESYIRKYNTDDLFRLIPAPDNLYYRWFKIRYRESFPLSCTLLIGLTDGYHAVQFFQWIFLSLAFGVLTDHWILYSIGIRVLIGIVFTIFYRAFQR